MDPEFRVVPTSHDSARVADISLRDPADEATARTRRILRAEMVNNVHDAAAAVKASLIHQKRHSTKASWEDVDSFNLVTLRAGQEVKLTLNCDETYRLYRALRWLYKAHEQDGIPSEEREYRVVDADSSYVLAGEDKDLLQRLVDQNGPAFWTTLADLEPGLLEAHAIAKLHQSRLEQVAEFERQLTLGTWSEKEWEQFFRENTWIFGQGLDYRFLSEVVGQPYFGGMAVNRTGAVRGDFLLATRARLRFTVVVEIKKPTANLLEPTPYRNDAYAVGPDVTGGVAQLQSQCANWAETAIHKPATDLLEPEDIYTVEPAGILVVGNLEQLAKGTKAENTHRRSSFERYRRNLSNPQIITYDELFDRARYIVEEPYLAREAVNS